MNFNFLFLSRKSRKSNLQTIFSDEIAGIPTETVLAIMQVQVWGGKTIL